MNNEYSHKAFRVLATGLSDAMESFVRETFSAVNYPTEARSPVSLSELENILTSQKYQLLIASDSNLFCSINDLLSACAKKLPVFVILNENSVNAAASCMKAGAKDVFHEGDRKRLFESFTCLRGDGVRYENDEFEGFNFKQIYGNSFNAVLLLEDFQVKLVNNEFLKLFRLENEITKFETVDLMEFIAPISRTFFAEIRERQQGGENLPDRYELTALTADKKEFEAEFRLSTVYSQGRSYTLGMVRDLTAAKLKEEELKESRRQLFSLMSNLPGMVYRCQNEPDWKLEFVNEGCYDLTGYHADELTQNRKVSYNEIIHPEDRAMVWESVQRGVSEKRQFEITYRIQTADGTVKWVIELGRGIFNDVGDLLFLEGFIADRTKQHLAEEKLKSALREWHLTFDGLSDAVALLDVHQGILQCNRAFAQLVGKEISEIIGRKCYEVIHQGTRSHIECPFSRMVETKSRSYVEMEIGNKYYDIFLDPLVDENGTITGAVQIMSDKTDKKKAENELLHSRQRTQLHIEQTPLGVIEWDLNFCVREWNPAAEKIFGFPKLEAIGRHASFIIPENFRGVVDEVWESLLNQKGGTRSSNLNVTKDGSTIFCDWFNTPLVDHEGHTVAVASLVMDITGQKKAREALSESENAYRGLFNTIQQAIYIQDAEGRFLDVNDGAVQMYGYPKEDFIGKFPDFLSAPGRNDFELLSRRLTLAFGGESQQFEFWGKKSGGEIFPKNVHLCRGRYFGKDVVIAIAEDISEQKEAEFKIKSSEAKYRSLAEQLPVGIYRSNAKGELLFVNSGLVTLFALDSVEEAMSMKAHEYLIEKQEREAWLRRLLNSENQSLVTEIWMRRKDGKPILVRDMSKLITDENGEVLYIDGILEDISDQRKAEETVRKLFKAVDNSPISIIITDKDGFIEYVNPYFCELTGYTSDEVIGKSPRILNSGYHPPDFYQGLWNTILSGQIWTGEIVNRKKNGDIFWESLAISAIYDSENRITNFVAVKDDITEKKEMIRELINAKERAEEMSRLKSSFLANMSHELRTPMIGILGYSEYLSEITADPAHRDMALTIHNSGKRLLETLNLILDLSKIEADKIVVEIKKVEVKALVEETVEVFMKAAEQKKLYLRFVSRIPEIYIKTDERLLREILNNLLNNAIKFTHSGGIVVEISRKSEGSEDVLIIRVKDTGIGISAENQKIIFEEFRQASEGLNRTFEGTGLGLTITKRFVQLLRGKITLTSEPGIGSVFSVILPLHYQAEKANPDMEIGQPHITEMLKDGRQKPHLLLVEDDQTNREVISMYLRDVFEVTVCESGEKAIKLAESDSFKMILMDINLGRGMNGLQVTKRLRQMKQYEKVPIIAVTAFAMRGDKEEFLDNGFSAYLAKPFGKKELQGLVKRLFPEWNS